VLCCECVDVDCNDLMAESSPGTTLSWASNASCLASDSPVRLCVLHMGKSFVVLEKVAGMLSVPGRGEHKRDSVTTRVMEVFPDATGPVNVHRLDMETSGLMVFALHRHAHRVLSRQFMHRKTGKTYLAILDGLVVEDEGEIDLPLIVDWENRPRQMVCSERGKKARTLYRVLRRDEERRRTTVEFRPITGRTHQLRVHAATPREQGGLGCPILGDSLYGDITKAPRLMLHANMLAFWDPDDGVWRQFFCGGV